MPVSQGFPFLCVLLLSVLLSVGLVGADSSFSGGFSYGSEAVRGVNIGGWLVLEPWITPSLFDNTGNDGIVDEWTFCRYQDRNVAQAALQQHWNTFYTQDDFADIAAAGLNHVRIPIGYWAFDVGPGEPYIQGQLPYLQNAVGWAAQYGLKVIIDLHGVPGSQNGFDNSGHKIPYPQWQTNPANVQRSNAIIQRIMSMYGSQTYVVTGVAPLNEPAGYFSDVLSVTRQYWYSSYGNVRFPDGNNQQSNTLLVIHDAFQPLSYWNNDLQPPQYQGVAVDTHQYQVFSNGQVAMTQQQHIAAACALGQTLSSSRLWVIVGEWSPASTDCARYLNGRGVGARYDGSYPGSPGVGSCNGITGSANSFSGDYKAFLRKFWEAQVIAYEKGEGWIQWAWKTESGTAEEWSYQAGLQHGWIPQSPTNLQFPNICG